MSMASCACGALNLETKGPPELTALCHCLACQRRTGAVFSANAFYPVDQVEVTGAANVFVRTADSGRLVRMYFCPTCGSTVYWTAEVSPARIGVGVGLFAEPAFTPPSLSAFERSKHDWVQLGGAIERFQQLPPQQG